MLVGLAGPTTNLSPGDEETFSHDEAVRLIDAGFAVPVAEEKKERAVKVAPRKEKRN